MTPTSESGDHFESFVSYAHADDRDGWVAALVAAIRAEHARFTTRPFGPDDQPPLHELPYAFVMERKKATPIGRFEPELRSPNPDCHAVTEPNGRLVLAR